MAYLQALHKSCKSVIVVGQKSVNYSKNIQVDVIGLLSVVPVESGGLVAVILVVDLI